MGAKQETALQFVRRTIRRFEDRLKNAEQYGHTAAAERCKEVIKVWREREADLAKRVK